MNYPRILVLGIGNILLSDEGVGIHVIRELERHSLPPTVKVVDGGTTGFELIRLFEGMQKVIIVDAISTDLEVGAVVRITPSELQTIQEMPFSAHQSGISTIIQQAALYYPATELIIIGVVVQEVHKFSMNISAEVKEKIPTVIATILREIEATDLI